MKEAMARLDCLFEPLKRLEAFQELRDGVRAGKLCALYGPDDSQRAHLLTALIRDADRNMVIFAPNDMVAMRMTEDLNVLLGGCARFLPAWDISFVKS